MDIKHYKPGRFTYLIEKPFVKELWDYLTTKKRVTLMLLATREGKPAIEFFLTELESRFEVYLTSPKYPEEEICVLINNMIKQILAMQGYEHLACGLCHHGRNFQSSGLYQKISGNTITWHKKMRGMMQTGYWPLLIKCNNKNIRYYQ